ncbi:MAG: PLP-dependent transferase [Euryarchaeota archaeon]|nr:PLP-dependent transferase [Euryarchaeota archaeon]
MVIKGSGRGHESYEHGKVPGGTVYCILIKTKTPDTFITDRLVRISVGLENVDDIKAAVKRALDAI